MSKKAVKRTLKTQTVTCDPYGRLPIQDAKENVTVVLSRSNISEGKKSSPAACAIARASRDQRQKFPGSFLCSWTYKTYTLVVTTLGQRMRAIRYVHPSRVIKEINGFDGNGVAPLVAGEEITLLAPYGKSRLGSGARSANPKVRNTGPNKKPRKRGIFTDPFHAAAAKDASDPDTTTIAD